MLLDNISVRRPVYDDYEIMAAILVEGWRSTYEGIVSKEYLKNLSAENAEKSMRENKNGNVFLVAEVKDKVVAFCRYSLQIPVEKQDGYDGTISELYVKTELRGMGIGRMLLDHVLQDFKRNGNCSVLLGCFSKNGPALCFYEKMGGRFVYEKNIEIGGVKYLTSFFQFNINVG